MSKKQNLGSYSYKFDVYHGTVLRNIYSDLKAPLFLFGEFFCQNIFTPIADNNNITPVINPTTNR
jgi:hypothetical protein